MVTCSKLRVSAHPRECHLKIQTLKSPFTCKRHTRNDPRRHATYADVCGSKLPPSAVPAWRGPLRSAEQQAHSDVLPVRQSTGTALRHDRLHLRKIQHRRATLPIGQGACLVLRSGCERQQRCASNGTQCHASKSARRLLPTTRCSVFLRVVSDAASRVFSAMLAPASNGKNSALMFNADPMPMRPKRHHTLIMRKRRWRRNDGDAHLTA